MPRFLVKADGPDATGIVAALTGALAIRGCSLEDTSATRLGGIFSMLVVVDAPEGETIESMVAHLDKEVNDYHLNVAVELLPDVSAQSPIVRGTRWEVTIHGSALPGIVSQISHRLANAGANIDDLSTRMIGGVGPSSYMVLIDATIPITVDGDALAADLESLGAELGVSCHAHRVD